MKHAEEAGHIVSVSLDLAGEAKAGTLSLLNTGMVHVCSVCNFDFQALVDDKFELEKMVPGSVGFVLIDRLYKERQVQNEQNLSHNEFCDMRAMIKFCWQVVRPTGHSHIFFEVLQFET